MTDERLAHLSRRLRSTGDPEDAARLLLERRRAGRLSLAQLVLLKTRGEAGADLLLVDSTPSERRAPSKPSRAERAALVDRSPPKNQARALTRSVRSVARLGRSATVVAAIAGARHAGVLGPALEAAEAWLACPCAEHAAAARKVAPRRPVDPKVGEERAVRHAAWALVQTIVVGDDAAAGRLASVVVRDAGLARPVVVCVVCPEGAARCTCGRNAQRADVASVQAVVDAALLAWARGERQA